MFAEWTDSFTLIPGAHGIFDLTVNGEMAFSKLKEKRFPEITELGNTIRKHLD